MLHRRSGSLPHTAAGARLERDSAILGRPHLVRVYLPPGDHENTLRLYPVLYMQDGKSLFFPEEAFLGKNGGSARRCTCSTP